MSLSCKVTGVECGLDFGLHTLHNAGHLRIRSPLGSSLNPTPSLALAPTLYAPLSSASKSHPTTQADPSLSSCGLGT